MEWKKIVVNDETDNSLISKIYEKVLNFNDMKFVYFSFMLGAFLVSVKKIFHYLQNHDHIKLFGWPKRLLDFSISCNTSFWPTQYMPSKEHLM